MVACLRIMFFCLLFLVAGCDSGEQVFDPADYGIKIGKTTEQEVRKNFKLWSVIDAGVAIWLDCKQFHVRGLQVVNVLLGDDKKVEMVSARYAGKSFEKLRDKIRENKRWTAVGDDEKFLQERKTVATGRFTFLNSKTSVRLVLSEEKGWTWLNYQRTKKDSDSKTQN